MSNEDVGKYIRKERTQKGFSVRQLALQSGVSASYISRLENNRTKHLIKMSTIKKLANGLRIDEKELFEKLNLSKDYNGKVNNQTLKIPLVKNPLLSSNIDDELNLIKYLPFLKEQINQKSKYVINYQMSNNFNSYLDKCFIVLSEIENLAYLNSENLVVFLNNEKFYLGYLKFIDKNVFFIDQNLDLFEIRINKNLKKHLFNVDLIFNRINN